MSFSFKNTAIVVFRDTGHSKYEYGQHSLMTAEMKQQAVERWNNKLASLKLHSELGLEMTHNSCVS